MNAWASLSENATFYFNVFSGVIFIILIILLIIHSMGYASNGDVPEARRHHMKGIIVVLVCAAVLSSTSLIVNILYHIAFSVG